MAMASIAVVCEQIAKVGSGHDAGMKPLAKARASPASRSLDCNDLSDLAVREIADKVRPPIAVPDDPDAYQSIMHLELTYCCLKKLSRSIFTPGSRGHARIGMSCQIPRVSITSRWRRPASGIILNSS